MFTVSRFYLFLAPDHVDLWRQRGRVLERLATLSPAEPDYQARLSQLFVSYKARHIGLLLNLPDLTVQAEPLPAVGLFDRRKLAARRLDYIFPQAALKGVRFGKTKVQLAALRQHPAITDTVQAIVQTGVELKWIAHAALEAARIVPKALQASPYFAVFKLGGSGLLLAGADGMLQAVRHLPLPAFQCASLAAEIHSTFAYLQRHGWQQARDLAFVGFGIPEPQVPGLTFTRRSLYPEADGYAELLAQLVQARRPLHPLNRPRLAHRKTVQTLYRGLSAAAATAAALSLACFIGCWYLFGTMDRHDRELTAAMASLPPPLAIQDLPLLQRLQTALDAPLALATALPNDEIAAIAYRAAPLAATETYSLRVTTDGPPAIAGWRLQAKHDLSSISGTIGKTQKAQKDTYNYTYEVKP